jgi:nitrogen-specific signal transduction histidine kinase
VSAAAPQSLLSFLDVPILVGDPDGVVAFLNPAAAQRFAQGGRAAVGLPLAQLFDGGVREAVLSAVANACRSGESVRFRIRHDGQGYQTTASPITSADRRVGVVLLFQESIGDDERVLTLCREMKEPLEDVATALDQLLEQTGGRRARRFRSLVEDAMRGLARVQKWSDELALVVSGEARSAPRSALDPARVIREAVAEVQDEFDDAGVSLELLAPSQLPEALGSAEILVTLLTRLLRSRLATAAESAQVTLSARAVGRDAQRAVVICVVDVPERDVPSVEESRAQDLRLVGNLLGELGADLHTVADPLVGRTTAIRLAATH